MNGFRTSVKSSDPDTQRTRHLNKTKYLCQYSFTVLFLLISLWVLAARVLLTLRQSIHQYLNAAVKKSSSNSVLIDNCPAESIKTQTSRCSIKHKPPFNILQVFFSPDIVGKMQVHSLSCNYPAVSLLVYYSLHAFSTQRCDREGKMNERHR